MNRILLCASLVSAITLPMTCDAAPRRSLRVGDIAGSYNSSNGKMSLRLVKTYKHDGFEQADFTGKMGDQPLVAQAYISGDEGAMDDFVRVELLFINTQDSTSVFSGQSVMKNGRVIGLQLKEQLSDKTTIFRRIAGK